MNKPKNKNFQGEETEEQKPKPRKEYGSVAASADKAWLMKQQEHHDWAFMIYPEGEEFSMLNADEAYGIWTTTYRQPLIFGHPDFRLDFEMHIDEDIFKFRVGEWDIECEGEPMRRWSDDKQAAWDHILASKNTKRTRDYGSKEVFEEFNRLYLGKFEAKDAIN